MSDPAAQPLRFVSVKLSPVGRSQSYLVDEGDSTRVPRPGEQVVVQHPGACGAGEEEADEETL